MYALIRVEPVCPTCLGAVKIPDDAKPGVSSPVRCFRCGWEGEAHVYFSVVGGEIKKLETPLAGL